MDEVQSTNTVPSKSGGSNKVIIIVVVVLVVLGISGYMLQRFIARKAGEKIAEGLLGAATGGKVDISSNGEGAKVTSNGESMSVGTSAKWPSDMPSNVPQFTYGTITMATKVNGSWSVLFEKVTANAQEKYTADLTAKGWSKDGDAIDVGVAKIVQVTDGKYSLTITFDPSSNGASLTITPKTTE